MPRSATESLLRHVPVLRAEEPVGEAVRRIVDAGMPALPVVDADGGLVGIFGEREFIVALFPGYLGELHYAGFVRETLDTALEKRAGCLAQPVGEYANREHIEVDEDWSDVGLAEIFLHHRVLIVPVVGEGGVQGVITRADFFRALVERASRPGA